MRGSAAMRRVVIDASVALAWAFEDEATPDLDRLLEMIAEGGEAAVPSLWPAEVANGLICAERKKRLMPAQSSAFLENLAQLPITLHATTIPQTFGQIQGLARQWGLSVYDACYLDLALRLGLPLATLDEDLKKAARRCGVASPLS